MKLDNDKFTQSGRWENMASFFNIEKIRALLESTAGKDRYARAMLSSGGDGRSGVKSIESACADVVIRTNDDLAKAIAEGMADYLRSYPAPASYKQILWDSCNSWYQRITKKLNVDAASTFEDELPRPVAKDMGVDLIKALHDENGKSKKKLSVELGVGEKTIQIELRALDPTLRNNGERIRPLRIAGQEMHPTIQSQYMEDGFGSFERRFYMKDRLHPIALQLNTQEAATLLLSLFKMNEATGSLLSREMALDIWCQLSEPGRDRIHEVFGSKDPDFKAFLNEIKAELEENRLVTFHTEEQQRDNNMSRDELVMSAFKGGEVCRIELKQGGKNIRIDKARIVPINLSEDRWLAIPADEYPDRTNAVPFTTGDVRDIR
jgi:hypothetical protein